jgi:hypothetical protein
MSFDLEIKNSIASLQAQVSSLGGAVDKTQASLARMGTQAKVTAGQTFEVSKNMEKIGSAASVAGGPVAGLMTKLGGLAAFNPMALAAGAAIGALTAGVYKLVDALKEANAERERMSAPIGNEAATSAIAAARADLKPEDLRAAVALAPGTSPGEIAAQGAATAARWIGQMPEWAQAHAGKPADIGESMVPASARQAALAVALSPEVRAAERIERRQAGEAAAKAELEDRAMRIAAGQAPRALSEGTAMYVLERGKSAEAEEYRRNTEELRSLRKSLEQLGRGMHTRAARSEIDSKIAEKSARQLSLIEANRIATESGQ